MSLAVVATAERCVSVKAMLTAVGGSPVAVFTAEEGCASAEVVVTDVIATVAVAEG